MSDKLTMVTNEAQRRLTQHASRVELCIKAAAYQGEDVDSQDLAIADLGSALRALLAAPAKEET